MDESTELKQLLTVGIPNGLSCSVDEEGAVLLQQGELAGAAGAARQPHHERVGGRSAAALEEPVEQVHTVRFVNLHRRLKLKSKDKNKLNKEVQGRIILVTQITTQTLTE